MYNIILRTSVIIHLQISHASNPRYELMFSMAVKFDLPSIGISLIEVASPWVTGVNI